VDRQGILSAFKENIGSVTSAVEEQVDLALEMYHPSWVLSAIREAVLHEKRTWAYIGGVLTNFQRYGGPKKVPK
jgi:DnaD/phage-associated family protein